MFLCAIIMISQQKERVSSIAPLHHHHQEKNYPITLNVPDAPPHSPLLFQMSHLLTSRASARRHCCHQLRWLPDVADQANDLGATLLKLKQSYLCRAAKITLSFDILVNL